MKSRYCLLLIILLLPLEIYAQKESTELKVKEILIHSVPRMLLTQIGISCDDFENSNNQFPFFKTFQLNSNGESDNKKISKLVADLNNYKDLSYPAKRLDIRAKIYVVYFSGRVDTFCMTSGKYYSYNGKAMSFADSSSYEAVKHLIWGNGE